MNSMQALDQPVALALSWMLTYLIHSTILVLSVYLVCRAIRPLARRIGAGAENLAWKLALVGAFVSASVQVAAGVDPVLGALELEAGTQVVEHAPVQTRDTGARVLVRERVAAPAVIDDGQAVLLGPVQAGPPLLDRPPGLELDSQPAPLWPKLLIGAWLLGAMIGLVRLLRSVAALRRKLADRSEVIDDPVLELFLTLCRDVDIRRKIRLTASPSISSPMALWRGEIVLPQRAIEELSPAAMRGVLAHELAHLERRDPHWLALAGVIEAVMFFQPLNRVARRGMQESAELLCDDWAIARTGDGVQFAKSLAELAAWSPAEPSSALVAAMVGERPLVRRVRRALEGDPRRFGEEEGPRPTRMLLGLGTLAALCMIAPGAVSASPPKQGVEDKRESKQAKKSERAQDKAAKAAAKAAEKAREARERAEQAQREAEAARLEAERAQREAEHRAPVAPGKQHLIIRDGDEYLIIDENGVRLHSDEADVTIIDGAHPRMKLRVHDGEVDVDLDVDLEDLESMAEGLMGGLLGPGMQGMPVMPGVPGIPAVPGVPVMPGFDGESFGPGFDPEVFEQEMEAWGREMEAWGEQFEQQFEQLDEEAIDREIEQRIRELEQLREQRRQHRKAPPAPPRPPRALAPSAPPAPLIPA